VTAIELGWKEAAYFFLICSGLLLNSLFLASPLRFLRDWRGIAFLIGMLASNGLLVICFDVSLLALTTIWLPAFGGLAAALWVRARTDQSRR
jgi:hypothetical protein